MRIFRPALIYSVFAIFVFLTSCSNISTPSAKEDASMSATATAASTAWPRITPGAELPSTGASVDQMFIDLVVPYQQAAVAMAQVAETQAQHQELKDFAANILKTAPDQINRLQGFREQWFGGRESPGMDQRPLLVDLILQGAAANTPQTLVDRLKSTGQGPDNSFDLAFIDALLEHHQMLITAAQMTQVQAQHAETKQLAQDIIDTNSREIERLMAFRSEWMSGDTPPALVTPTAGLQAYLLP